MASFNGAVIIIIAFLLGRFVGSKTKKEIEGLKKFILIIPPASLLFIILFFTFFSVDETSYKIVVLILAGFTLSFIMVLMSKRHGQESLINYYLLMVGLWLVQFLNEVLYSSTLLLSSVYFFVHGSLTKKGTFSKVFVIFLSVFIGALFFITLRPTAGGAYVTLGFCLGGAFGAELAKYDFRSKGKARKKRAKSS